MHQNLPGKPPTRLTTCVGSIAYRQELVRVCVARCLRSINQQAEKENFPRNPVLLWGVKSLETEKALSSLTLHGQGAPIITTINGKSQTFYSGHHKTLLRFLREEAGLTGTKRLRGRRMWSSTVFLDGKAVMACLVPAQRAHLAIIETVEGLSKEDGALHPVQQAFIDEGAVQCGYCTPGLIMSAAKLLEERPHPSRDEVMQSITGNLCRCTGYYKIIQAIEKASSMEASDG